jgi:hypothetical protein
MNWWLRYGIWRWLSDRPRKIKSFFQRGRRGWADEDTWDFDNYLAQVIAEGITHLKSYQHILPTYKPGLESEQDAQKRWNDILNQIVVAFKYAKLYTEAEISPKEWEEKYKVDYDKGMDLFKEYFFALWD